MENYNFSINKDNGLHYFKKEIVLPLDATEVHIHGKGCFMAGAILKFNWNLN